MASLGLGYYGSWLNVVSTITTDQQNFNIWTHISQLASTNYGWNRNGGKKLRGIITINSGVNIYSENPLNPAITIPADSSNTFREYDQILIINNGNIYGAGGTIGSGGGASNGTDGGKGGTAIYTRRNIILTNNGKIYGGGGGGGGGGGAFLTSVSTGSTNCGGSAYCGKCCILNCNGRNFCSTPNDCALGASCGSYCEYYTNGSSCNDSTVGTCNWKSRDCTTYTGGNGGRGQGYNKNFGLGIDGVLYSASVFTGDGGDGGNWGEAGQNGLAGSTTSYGNGGEAGCWIDGNEFLYLQKSNDEKGLRCNSSASQAVNALWSGWSATPSVTTNPINGSGVTHEIVGNDLNIEPRQSLISLIVNNPTNLGGQINLSNCSLLETFTCNDQAITTLNLTNCHKLKTINFNDNSLSTLDVSSCLLLQTLNLDNNNLQGNLSGLGSMYTPLNESRTISVKNNNMTAQHLNNLFNSLPSKNLQNSSEWSIYIDDNPGVCECDWSIAKSKGWVVYPTQYILTSNTENVDEGTSVSFMLETSLLGDGTIPYNIDGINSADISGASLNGNFNLYKGSDMVTFNIADDFILEGDETMTLSINSATCPTSKSVRIIDNATVATLTISTNTNNYNGINTFLTNNGWDGTQLVDLTIIVNSGVTVGSTSHTSPALSIPILPFGSIVKLINNGNIYGAGGAGGTGTSSTGNDGSDGGTAIQSGTRIIIDNYGNIKGGGGGGGGGGGYSTFSTSCSWGGCGAACDSCQNNSYPADCCSGTVASGGCPGGTCASGSSYCQCYTYKNNGKFCKWCASASCNCVTTGSNYNGGNGGIGQGSGNVAASGTTGASGTLGGTGGAFGSNGTRGGNYSSTALGGNGGLAGYYLRTLSGATYTITPDLGGTVAGRIE